MSALMLAVKIYADLAFDISQFHHFQRNAYKGSNHYKCDDRSFHIFKRTEDGVSVKVKK